MNVQRTPIAVQFREAAQAAQTTDPGQLAGPAQSAGGTGGPGASNSADRAAVVGVDGPSFGARLVGAQQARGPLCVGVDPHPSLLDDWSLPRTAAGVESFVMTVLEALGDRVAVVKPQSAFFEAHGSAGIAVLERFLAAARGAGTLTLMDAKRGDIGSTMAAYASAYLTDGSPLAADAVTVSPYLGFGSLRPAVEAALASGRGLLVLARTSNPEGGEVQAALGQDGRSVGQTVADAAAALNAGADPLGSIGLVIGATVEPGAIDLTRLNGPVLAPGLGAQGGTADGLRRIFEGIVGSGWRGLLPSSSRDILAAGPSIAGLREAAARTQDQLRAALG